MSSNTFSSRADVIQAIQAQKVRLGLSWAKVAQELGQSKEWSTAACLGQMQLDEEEADKVIQIFQLSPEAKPWLQTVPNRGLNMSMGPSPTDPLLYRFQEVLNVYGLALKELIHEEFGDGIMSAIDFKLHMEREPSEQGDRVKLIWSGKFLPYKRF